MTRTGLFGGTFDPIHVGHLTVASSAMHELELDRVLFVVAHRPWQKVGSRSIAPSELRLAMVEAATSHRDDFVASGIEIERGGASYTFDTVTALQRASAEVGTAGVALEQAALAEVGSAEVALQRVSAEVALELGESAEVGLAEVALELGESAEVGLAEVALELGESAEVGTAEVGDACEFVLIVGSDVVPDLDTWYRHDELRELVELAVIDRPGGVGAEPPAGWRYQRVSAPLVNLSSSMLRSRMAAGRPVDYLVPRSAMKVYNEWRESQSEPDSGGSEEANESTTP